MSSTCSCRAGHQTAQDSRPSIFVRKHVWVWRSGSPSPGKSSMNHLKLSLIFRVRVCWNHCIFDAKKHWLCFLSLVESRLATRRFPKTRAVVRPAVTKASSARAEMHSAVSAVKMVQLTRAWRAWCLVDAQMGSTPVLRRQAADPFTPATGAASCRENWIRWVPVLNQF